MFQYRNIYSITDMTNGIINFTILNYSVVPFGSVVDIIPGSVDVTLGSVDVIPGSVDVTLGSVDVTLGSVEPSLAAH